MNPENDPKKPENAEKGDSPAVGGEDATPIPYSDLFLPPELAGAIEKAITESMRDEPGKLPPWMRSQSARQAFQDAFETVGGLPRLSVWAHYNYSKFIALYARLIPMTVTGDPDAPVTVIAPWLNGSRFAGAPTPQTHEHPPQQSLPQPPAPATGSRDEPPLPSVPDKNSH